MGKPFIFGYQVDKYTDGVTKFDKLSVLLIRRLSSKLVPMSKSVGTTASCREVCYYVGNSASLSFQEKLLKFCRSDRT